MYWLAYNFECDWLTELSDNKLSKNCLIQLQKVQIGHL